MAAKPAPKPKPKAEPPQERTVLTARIGELLDENQHLIQDLATARAEANALARALNALERNESKKEQYSMPTTLSLGDMVEYLSADPKATPLAALVIAVHEDGKADLKVFNGYALGTMDVQNVEFSETVEPSKASKLGAKPKATPAPTTASAKSAS
jgi:hypothetical protein